MKTIKCSILVLLGQSFLIPQAFAGTVGVPEMDGAGLIIGIALAAGLVALLREKFFK